MGKMERKEYLKTRENYTNELSKQSELLDKYLLTISTGSFGLSFLFVEKIVKICIKKPQILVFSWIMFACSIVSSLLSFIFSKSAFSKTIDEYDKMYENEDYKFKTPIQDYFTTIANWYAFGFLLLGFISFIIFAFYNVIGD